MSSLAFQEIPEVEGRHAARMRRVLLTFRRLGNGSNEDGHEVWPGVLSGLLDKRFNCYHPNKEQKFIEAFSVRIIPHSKGHKPTSACTECISILCKASVQAPTFFEKNSNHKVIRVFYVALTVRVAEWRFEGVRKAGIEKGLRNYPTKQSSVHGLRGGGQVFSPPPQTQIFHHTFIYY